VETTLFGALRAQVLLEALQVQEVRATVDATADAAAPAAALAAAPATPPASPLAKVVQWA